MTDDARTFYRTDSITGEVTERTVITAADEVRAKFDGFRAEKKSGAAKKAPAAGSSTSTPASGEAAK